MPPHCNQIAPIKPQMYNILPQNNTPNFFEGPLSGAYGGRNVDWANGLLRLIRLIRPICLIRPIEPSRRAQAGTLRSPTTHKAQPGVGCALVAESEENEIQKMKNYFAVIEWGVFEESVF